MKTALITGITGQDGSYLSEFLLSKGYNVVGLVRRNSTVDQRSRLDHLPAPERSKLKLEYGDLLDISSMAHVLKKHRPDEVYNLAAQSHVKISFDQPLFTSEVTGLGALNLLEAIRISDINCRFYQASSSEMFGKVQETPQTESTPFHPRSPYGVSKLFAHWAAINYRESYGMWNACGILFNHESPRRGENFVTRKITLQANRIKAGLDDRLILGNTGAKRDWGFAGDYVRAMWLMLQHAKPDDFVIATGKTHSVEEFCQEVFGYLGLDYRKYVGFDERYMRPAEVELLRGDSSKARMALGWKPEVTFQGLARMMADADKVANRA
jgi:GDPmannose 4,6-dehydratase